MIRPVDIKLNAAHPELPLVEATTFTGAPSSVFIRGVPKAVGNWSITAVSVAVTYPDNTTTARAAVESAEGVWVATIPGTATSGRTAAGFKIMADGIDENGAAVTGYVLGFSDFAVLSFFPVPAPGETFFYLRYFDTMPTTAKKMDVTTIDGILKYYNGTAWLPFAAYDDAVTHTSANGVKSSAIWSAIWGALSALPTGFTSLYDWCVDQLAGKLSLSGGEMNTGAVINFGSGGLLGGAKYAISRSGIKKMAASPFGDSWTKTWDDVAETSKTVPTSRTVNGKALTDDVTLTGADIAVSGTDATKIDAALAGKLDSTSAAPAFSTSSTYAVGDHVTYNGALYRCTTAVTTAGAWDASKWTADMASNYFQYALVAKTIDNGAVSLDDRASNSVTVSATVSATLSPNTLTVNFPTATSGKVRDFAMRLNIAAGVTAPEIAWPQGVTLENDGGKVPEISDGGTGGSSTILYFSETENNGTTAKFLVKGETLTAITQA